VVWRPGSLVGVTYELLYTAEADEALDMLEGDPRMATVLRAVDRTLVRLAADPFNPRLGTIPFITEPLGGVCATSAGIDDWYVIWQRAPEPETIDIIAIIQIQR